MRLSKTQMKIVGLSALAASVLSAGVAFALPNNEVETTYYSDASKTEEVGYNLLSCNGHIFSSGVVTAYVQVNTTSCATEEHP